MIRKHDFITGERLLQSFPYILLDQDWVEKLRKKTLLLAERAHHYFKDTLADYSIRSWQKRVIKYLEEQKRLPFPLLRLYSDWLEIYQDKHFLSFQSARGEDFQLPLYLTEDLSYLIGVIMGDGHLAEYYVNIIDASKEHIENLTQMLVLQFNSKTEFFKHTSANAWNVNILCKWIVRLFNFLSGQPINERKYPSLREPLIFQTNPLLRNAFWRGLMDADGSYKSSIGFGSASQKLLNDFSAFLTQHNIQHRFYTQTVLGGTTYSLKISGESRKRFTQLISSDHPIKKQEMQILLDKKIHRFTENSATLRKRGVWDGQVITVNQEKLFDGYFDLSLIPHLRIANLGNYIRALRRKNGLTQQSLSSEFSITQTLLSKYERNSHALPIPILIELLLKLAVPLKAFFSTHSKLDFHSHRSKCCLNTQSSEDFLKILHGMQFKEGGLIMIHGKENEDLDNYRKKISSFFSLKIHKTHFHNTVLNSFVREFFILRS